MTIKQAYNSWAQQYDTNQNKTRDLEAQALRECLGNISFATVLEIGCGTGKNTPWLAQNAQHLTAIDFSEEMLARAKQKVISGQVQFRQADITTAWTFGTNKYDLVTFSLVLEHIQDLDHVFREAAAALLPGGRVYLGELHPYKQYLGSKARFETAEGKQQVVECFTHHLSDFILTAQKFNFRLQEVQEYFDDNNRTNPPRILTLLLQKILQKT